MRDASLDKTHTTYKTYATYRTYSLDLEPCVPFWANSEHGICEIREWDLGVRVVELCAVQRHAALPDQPPRLSVTLGHSRAYKQLAGPHFAIARYVLRQRH